MTLPRTAARLAAVMLALAPVAAWQGPATPTLADLLMKAAAYEDAYSTKVSGVTLEELLLLIGLNGNQMRVPTRIASDLVIVKINVSGQLLGLRDPFSIDTRTVRPREQRIARALEQPTLASWAAVQGYVRENAQFLEANVVAWFSDPVLAMQFITATNQPRLIYKLEGNKKLNGVQVYAVGFKEREEPGARYLLDTPGNPLASGRFWIDPATGAIHQTELWVQSDADTARVHVLYAPDSKLGMLLPREAGHTFETRERGSGGLIGPNAAKLGFESNATYSNPRYAPVDLTHIIAR